GASRAAGRRSSATALLGVCAIVVSLGAAAVLPHLPVRYLADGLGTGGIGGRGQVGFSPSTQMVQDLRSTQGRPILHYRTDDPTPPPLRVAVSSVYRNGEWVPDDDAEVPSTSPRLRYPLGWQQEVSPAEQRQIEVTDNRLAAPYLASPPDVIEGRVYDAQWAQGRTTGVLTVDSVPGRYSLTYLDITPEPRVLRDEELQVYPRSAQETLDGSEITPLVWDLAQQVTADADGAYDQAMAIQEWLRSSGGFTYSLELAPPPPGLTEEEANATAVDRFLETKRGYCVQFTTVMVLMARSLGIPARTATGFLPGTEVDGVREVVPSDAHAWPELYFAGVGWLRFEPTPGTRSGTPPAYSVAQPAQGEGTASPTASASAASPSPTAAASTPAPQRPERDLDARTPGEQPAQGRSWWWALLAPLALLLAAAILPVAAWRSRRARLAVDPGHGRRGQRAHGGADADRVEAHWAELLERVGDLGVAVDAADTLTQQQESLRAAAALREDEAAQADGADEALVRLVATVQTARYAPPGSLSREAVRRVPGDARLVRRAVLRASDR
ncbi:transglutaminase family protein, partial [Piscicoccus intestinalis]|uniref:transglutaminase family protein n=1 Tax=Piscicoccus intestinalis TaxID=746033 RepID=UPI0008389C84